MRIRGRIFVAVFSILLATTGITLAQAPQTSAPVGTTVPPPQPAESLPRPDFRFKGQVGRTYQDSDPPTFPQVLRPPKGAPNVLLILLDDVGFGQFSVFGGGVPSPEYGEAGGTRSALYALPHNSIVLAVARPH